MQVSLSVQEMIMQPSFPCLYTHSLIDSQLLQNAALLDQEKLAHKPNLRECPEAGAGFPEAAF